MATTEDRRRADATAEWRRELYEAKPERDALFSTMSGVDVEPLYTPDNVEIQYDRDLGFPGVFPYTRGVYPSMYRGRLWTMRQFAGFGMAEETNARFRYLLEHGQTGLSTAFDMPTLMGYDSDHPKSLGEVGREGVAVDSLEDMELLFDGIPLDKVSTSMTINGPAAMLLGFYVCVADEQGVPHAPWKGESREVDLRLAARRRLEPDHRLRRRRRPDLTDKLFQLPCNCRQSPPRGSRPATVPRTTPDTRRVGSQ